jgi:predicted PolB exonuclease-like 3'-5' exonuclease
MQFTVFALSTVPDTATTRRLLGLDDLDDKAVSKVLFHRRKQQTGSSEVLRWDQRAIASITLIRHSQQGVQLESLNAPQQTEEALLDALFQAASHSGRMVAWNAEDIDLPLIRFRCLKYSIGLPECWQTRPHAAEIHIDIARWMCDSATDRPMLDGIARKLGFPGMLNRSEQAVMDAWLRGAQDEVRAFSDISALNSYLLALRLFAVRGEISGQESATAVKQLKALLAAAAPAYFSEFLSAWGGP